LILEASIIGRGFFNGLKVLHMDHSFPI